MTPQEITLTVGTVNAQLAIAQLVLGKRSTVDLFFIYVLAVSGITCLYIGLTLY